MTEIQLPYKRVVFKGTASVKVGFTVAVDCDGSWRRYLGEERNMEIIEAIAKVVAAYDVDSGLADVRDVEVHLVDRKTIEFDNVSKEKDND